MSSIPQRLTQISPLTFEAFGTLNGDLETSTSFLPATSKRKGDKTLISLPPLSSSTPLGAFSSLHSSSESKLNIKRLRVPRWFCSRAVIMSFLSLCKEARPPSKTIIVLFTTLELCERACALAGHRRRCNKQCVEETGAPNTAALSFL